MLLAVLFILVAFVTGLVFQPVRREIQARRAARLERVEHQRQLAARAAREEDEIGQLCREAAERELLLPALQGVFTGLDARVFGSSVKKNPGYFTPPPRYRSDVDIAVVVGDDIFALWAKRVYGTPEKVAGHLDPWEYIDGYGNRYMTDPRRRPGDLGAVALTRDVRLRVGKDVLGFELGAWFAGIHQPSIDLFLFPESFVSGKRTIPAWEGGEDGRNFREEVLAVWQPLAWLTAVQDSSAQEEYDRLQTRQLRELTAAA